MKEKEAKGKIDSTKKNQMGMGKGGGRGKEICSTEMAVIKGPAELRQWRETNIESRICWGEELRKAQSKVITENVGSCEMWAKNLRVTREDRLGFEKGKYPGVMRKKRKSS